MSPIDARPLVSPRAVNDNILARAVTSASRVHHELSSALCLPLLLAAAVIAVALQRRRGSLLDDMDCLMGNQACIARILARTEEDVLAPSECTCRKGLGCCAGVWTGVHTHAAQVGVEGPFYPAADVGWHRSATARSLDGFGGTDRKSVLRLGAGRPPVRSQRRVHQPVQPRGSDRRMGRAHCRRAGGVTKR